MSECPGGCCSPQSSNENTQHSECDSGAREIVPRDSAEVAAPPTCATEGCCGGISRRRFLALGGAGIAYVMLDGSLPQIALAEDQSIVLAPHHRIPIEKNLSAEWIRKLFERGVPEVWKGPELETIGLPIGGIGTGQLYLCGDGTLGNWEIFNQHEFFGYGDVVYRRRAVKRPVDQGFAVVTEDSQGGESRTLDKSGFADIQFRGSYPWGRVTYEDAGSKVRVTLEAMTPFIPLNAKDSALPATVFQVTVENVSKDPLRAGIASWLENPIGAVAEKSGWDGERWSRVTRSSIATKVLLGARRKNREETEERPPVVVADFEGESYGEWTATGEAFGSGPTGESLPHQQAVSGFLGSRCVNSFHGGDDTKGTLTSPPFLIARRFMNFLIAGGDKPELAGMRLEIDGKVVRSVTGDNTESLDWQHWDVSEFEGKEARLVIFDDATGPWGHVLADQIEQADRPRASSKHPADFEHYPDYGTMCLAYAGEGMAAGEITKLPASRAELRSRIGATEDRTWPLTERGNAGLFTPMTRLKPGDRAEFFLVLAWHFPNTVRPGTHCGHEYAVRFPDAESVADYVLRDRERLLGDSRKWRETYYDSTLPVWLLDRLHLTSCCLSTGTAQWWSNGRFWAWEGVVCCEGTCTHVWNYAQSVARLFPELERSAREMQDFGAGFNADTGLVGFRGTTNYAADGQCGTILKAYREHLMSSDVAFLRRNWTRIRKAIEYLLVQDTNEDGLIENSQHNTYDINFEGPNTFVGSLYLAALRAGEEMAKEMGEVDYAARLRRIFGKGSKQSLERLWNGEYFIQEVDLQAHPKHQYGPGCLSDQLFGQGWAHQIGLGYVYPKEHVRSALESVWKYNWAPDVGPYQKELGAERPFAEAAEAGLFLCTWPKSEYLKSGVLYKNEVWTGIEYQVAGHMIREGMVQEGLAICRAVHERYQPAKRNPFNEVECGDYYARAMSSWGVLLALCGFEYHGPRGHIGFAPRVSADDFRAPFTAAEGWGTYRQRIAGEKMTAEVSVRWGRLRLRSIALELPDTMKPVQPKVRLNKHEVKATAQQDGNRVVLHFAEDVLIWEGESLEAMVAV